MTAVQVPCPGGRGSLSQSYFSLSLAEVFDRYDGQNYMTGIYQDAAGIPHGHAGADGHANATTTANIYAHQIALAKAKAAEARAGVFSDRDKVTRRRRNK